MAVTKLSGDGKQHGYVQCTVVSGTTKSTVADLEGYGDIGLMMPVTDSGTTFSFEVSNLRDGDYYPLVTAANVVSTVSGGTGEVAIASLYGSGFPYRYVKVVLDYTPTTATVFTFCVKA